MPVFLYEINYQLQVNLPFIEQKVSL